MVRVSCLCAFFFFFFNDTATTEIYTLSLHYALPSSKAMAWIPDRAVAARTRSGEVIWILSTLPNAVPALAVMGLYRLRWQIELLFKRLKSLLHLDTLPSRQGP